MALPLFKSFISTVARGIPRPFSSVDRLLTHPITGAPIGIQNASDNGPNGMWAPVDITPAQEIAPTQAMLDDLDATYRVNAAPYTRYQSNGSALVAIGSSSEVVIPPGFNEMFYAPLTISPPQVLTVQGQLRVISYPA